MGDTDSSIEVDAPDGVDEVEDDVQEAPSTDEDLGENGLKALRKERQKNRALESRLRELESGSKPKAQEGSSTDVDEIRNSIRAELATEFALELATAQAENELKDAGYRGNPKRGARSLDLKSVISDGKVDPQGLRDAIDEWKEDEPNLFKRTRAATDEEDEAVGPGTARRPVGSADLGKKSVAHAPQNAAEAMAAKRFGKSR